jgi:hypothetical protein
MSICAHCVLVGAVEVANERLQSEQVCGIADLDEVYVILGEFQPRSHQKDGR